MENIDKLECLIKILTEENDIDGKKYLLSEDFEKFYIGGNKRAGTRIRKIMQRIRSAAQDVRTDIQEYKKNI
jgi:hypothetical protein